MATEKNFLQRILSRFNPQSPSGIETPRRRSNKILSQTVQQQLFRANQQIETWRDAINEAEDIHTPDRTELIRLYEDLKIDDQLTAAINNRILQVMGSKFFIYNANNEVDEKASEIFEQPWFETFCKEVINSRFYGYSLIQLGDVTSNGFDGVEAVKREYVDPIRRGVKKGIYETINLVSFDDPIYKPWLIFVDSKDLGLFNQCAPLVIWKKNAYQFWSNFGELFGVPWRVGKTNVEDKVRRQNMYKMLEDMGSAPYAVIDEEDELNLIESQKTDAHQVFSGLIEKADSGISKLILGQTMTMDNGSSRSQAEVHERVGDYIILSDKKLLKRVVNFELIPRMVRLGLIPNNLYFDYDNEEKLDFEQRLNAIDILKRSGFKISPETILELTGIEVEEKEEQEQIKQKLDEINNMYKGVLDQH